MEANGMSDIEGKAARVAANERGAVSESQLTGLKGSDRGRPAFANATARQARPLHRGGFSFAHRFGHRLVDRRRFDGNNLELSVWQRHGFAGFTAKQRLTYCGLIRNDISIWIAVPSAENCVGLLLL